MTCWQCINYRAGGDGFISAYCDAGKTGFPFIGNKCAKFEYEPGADEQHEEIQNAKPRKEAG